MSSYDEEEEATEIDKMTAMLQKHVAKAKAKAQQRLPLNS